jgi:AbrB family transcriptional regulator (stage V sporulation protein T)
MKATGIVRRIDDLGRVVIPKEVRQQLSIREGDPLELYMSDDGRELVLRKYDTTAPIRSIVNQLADMTSDQDIFKDLEEDTAVALRALIKILKNNVNKLDPQD